VISNADPWVRGVNGDGFEDWKRRSNSFILLYGRRELFKSISYLVIFTATDHCQ
jgi:hypothetical protein